MDTKKSGYLAGIAYGIGGGLFSVAFAIFVGSILGIAGLRITYSTGDLVAIGMALGTFISLIAHSVQERIEKSLP